MSLEQLSSEQILNLSPDQLKEYVQKYKEKYHIETERNFDARLPDNVDCLYDICKYAWSVTRQKENVEMPNHISMNKATLLHQEVSVSPLTLGVNHRGFHQTKKTHKYLKPKLLTVVCHDNCLT